MTDETNNATKQSRAPTKTNMTNENVSSTQEASSLHSLDGRETLERKIAAAVAHRACCGSEHDPAQGKLHGYCVVCGVEWPCETASAFLFAPIEKLSDEEPRTTDARKRIFKINV